MTQVLVNNIQVQFPYEPYQVQVDYMTKVMECLQQGANGILESPTGTGKTLSLLCATLAWLEHKKAQQQVAIIQHSGVDEKQGMLSDLKAMLDGAAGGWNPAKNFMTPLIIYSSRTHSQLSQAVQELKRSSYKHVKSVVLGSRDQLCLHAEVSKAQNHTTKLYMCRARVSSKTCPFGLNVEEKVLRESDYQNNSVMDIEDLVTLGKKHTCCPYYAARNLKSKADIIFTPYNYIIDPKTRRAHGIELEGNVVIFDEAHNIEGACEESMSFQLRSIDLAHCINEVTQTIDMVKDFDKEFSSSDTGAPDFTVTDLSILKVMFCELEEHLDKAVAECSSEGCSKPGNYMIEILSKVELTPQRKDLVLDLLDKIILYHSTSVTSPWASKGTGLQKFSDILKILFSRASNIHKPVDINKEFALKYQVYLQYETTNKSQKSDPWTVVPANPSKKQSWKLDCWCFCPGLGMQEVMDHGVHSIILTSGTLSPLPPLISELGIGFPVQLENPHIIRDEQVFVAVIPNGPDGTMLNSSYQNRSNQNYIGSLGRTVSNFCRVTPYGVLVFFPSYSVMKNNIGSWEDSSIWHNLSGIKPLFVEPQGKDAFQASIEQFYSKINDPQTKGAALFAVCRGKVSEGLDFADRNARAVIITGLPFPPSMDPRVKMKMAYLNKIAKENKGLYGTEWYVLQASRAVNQAIGRVIRHKNDFGAILLCDNRFGEKRIQSHLSKWIQGRIKSFTSFGPAMRELSSFFRTLESAPRTSTPAPGSCFNVGRTVVPNITGNVVIRKALPATSQSWNESMSGENIFDGYLNAPQQAGNTNNAGSVSLHNPSKNKSIFAAIEDYAVASSSTASVESKMLANRGEEGNSKTSKSDESVGGYNSSTKRRKISIQFRGAEPESEDHNRKVNEREMWKNHLAQIKSALGATDKYARFCTSVKEYKSGKDVLKFSSDIRNIFTGISDKDKYLHISSLLVGNQDRKRFMEHVSGAASETFR